MDWNPGDGTGIVDEINDICQSDDQNYPIESKVRRANNGIDRFFTIGFESDGRWTLDDVSQSGVPIFTQDLNSGQQRYALDDFVSDILKILRFEVDDASGNGKLLTRLDRTRVTTALSEYKKTPGTPSEYDLIGDSVDLYAPPNYTLVDGFKVYVDRNGVKFQSSDTTVEPGIPSIFHMYLARVASLPFLGEFGKDNYTKILKQIGSSNPRDPYYGGDELQIAEYFQSREKGVPNNMRPRHESNR